MDFFLLLHSFIKIDASKEFKSSNFMTHEPNAGTASAHPFRGPRGITGGYTYSPFLKDSKKKYL